MIYFVELQFSCIIPTIKNLGKTKPLQAYNLKNEMSPIRVIPAFIKCINNSVLFLLTILGLKNKHYFKNTPFLFSQSSISSLKYSIPCIPHFNIEGRQKLQIHLFNCIENNSKSTSQIAHFLIKKNHLEFKFVKCFHTSCCVGHKYMYLDKNCRYDILKKILSIFKPSFLQQLFHIIQHVNVLQ